ncbi:protein fem-1 homolog C-like [Mizuhopecten yessoensis]|uniref:Protein fem-1-like C n=1 Tax=Mizuhopecten yessoensis TaxID=6573 RepID=A0A210Q603_MIZYE|nr:protein fem-1 homolog C-like [Mizuhopecten yessoensis]XP_021366293.1 protein fem-1 homolog C-like [Mizuhopecten yessoensis]OWF44170.1 Protein fem-1-like C [Mizuhopecten yessoensis]
MWETMSPEKVYSYAHFIHTIIRTGDDKLKVLKENLSSKELTAEVCSKVLHHLVNDKAALYIACEEGHLDIIRYLVSEWKVDIEQRGHYKHKHFHDHVPPLWSCTERNSIEVLRLLISLGADINCTSSTNGTALLVGCLHDSAECVKELIKAGADVNTPNIYGATPLLNAASKGSLSLCEFLINNGADVLGRDCNGRTTLHRAVEENRLDVVKLLIEKGCDCTLLNDTEESAFRQAALKGSHEIVEYIAKNVSLDPIDIIETYELLGAFDAEKDDYEKASKVWVNALELRGLEREKPILKSICDTLGKYTDHVEVSSADEIKGLTSKEEFMVQSLLVRERILGPSHSETIWSLDYCGAVYADMNNYSNCIKLWKCAYKRLVDKRRNCTEDCTFRIQAIMKVFVDIAQERKTSTKFPSKDLLDIFEILICSLQFGCKMFNVRPREEQAAKQIAILMKMALQLMNLLLMQELHASDLDRLKHLAECAVNTGIKDEDGRTLLHLSMEAETSTTNEYTYTLFPSFQVLKLLVDVGANVNGMDNMRNTVLHYCGNSESHQVAGYLLDNHAHADVRNSDGLSALERLISSGYRVCPMEHCTLKCLAATAVTRNKINFQECLPKTLYSFVEIHRFA